MTLTNEKTAGCRIVLVEHFDVYSSGHTTPLIQKRVPYLIFPCTLIPTSCFLLPPQSKNHNHLSSLLQMPNRANTNVNRSKRKARKAKQSKAKGKRGRKSWATGEQLETLKKHLAVYRNEVRGKLKQNGVTKFYDNVTADFLDKYRWDIPHVTDCDIENIGGRGHPPNTSGLSRSIDVSSTSNTAGPSGSDSTSSPDASMPTNASNGNALTPGNSISFSFTNSETGVGFCGLLSFPTANSSSSLRSWFRYQHHQE